VVNEAKKLDGLKQIVLLALRKTPAGPEQEA
jgi:hypothetical protein